MVGSVVRSLGCFLAFTILALEVGRSRVGILSLYKHLPQALLNAHCKFWCCVFSMNYVHQHLWCYFTPVSSSAHRNGKASCRQTVYTVTTVVLWPLTTKGQQPHSWTRPALLACGNARTYPCTRCSCKQ